MKGPMQQSMKLFLSFLKKGGWIVILLLVFMYKASTFRISKNFFEVESGRFYRSAQLNEREFKDAVDKYHIKTVLSLRGPPTQTIWYKEEEKVLADLGVHFEYLGMKDEYYPTQDQMRHILSVLKEGPFPILIHCRNGSDRTGLVSAIYKKYFMNSSDAEAKAELSFKYWHVPYFKPAMNQFFTKIRSLNWLENDYNICDPEFSEYRNPRVKCN